MKRRSNVWLVLTFGTAVGCTDSTVSTCVPGATSACACLGALVGVQTCGAEGTFGACTCGSDSGSPDAATLDLPSVPDSRAVELDSVSDSGGSDSEIDSAPDVRGVALDGGTDASVDTSTLDVMQSSDVQGRDTVVGTDVLSDLPLSDASSVTDSFGITDASCGSGLVRCGDNCVNVRVDDNNCGACGRSCELNHAVAHCVGGECTISSCASGFSSCDSNSANGCESNTASDRTHCGSCMTACAEGASCVLGSCSCAAGSVVCSGRCTDVTTSAANCGACGHACLSSQICDRGTCTSEVTCASDFLDTVADCEYIPISSLSCGPVTEVSRRHYTGASNDGLPIVFPLTDFRPSDRLSYTGNFSVIGSMSGTNYDLSLRNSLGVVLASASSTAYAATPATSRLTILGSQFSCEHANQLVLRTTFNTNLAWDIEEVWQRMPEFNSGGTSASTPQPLRLNSTTGRVCAQACGSDSNRCSEGTQYYSLSLPAHSKLLVELMALSSDTAGSNVYLSVLRPSGAEQCGMLINDLSYDTPRIFRASVTNHGASTRDLVIAPRFIVNSRSVQWRMVATVVPLSP